MKQLQYAAAFRNDDNNHLKKQSRNDRHFEDLFKEMGKIRFDLTTVHGQKNL